MKPWISQVCSAAAAVLFSYLVFDQVFPLSIAFACCAAASVTTRRWSPIRSAVAALVFLVACHLIVTAPGEISGLGPISSQGFMDITRTVASFFVTAAAGLAIAVLLVIYSTVYATLKHYDGYPSGATHNSDK